MGQKMCTPPSGRSGRYGQEEQAKTGSAHKRALARICFASLALLLFLSIRSAATELSSLPLE